MGENRDQSDDQKGFKQANGLSKLWFVPLMSVLHCITICMMRKIWDIL